MALPETESQLEDDGTWKTLFTRDGNAGRKFLKRLNATNLDEIVHKYPNLIQKVNEEDIDLEHIIAFFVRDELSDDSIESEFEVFLFAWGCFILFLKLNWFQTKLPTEEAW